MSKFHVGQKVICVQPDRCSNLVEGKIYTVLGFSHGMDNTQFIEVENIIGEFFERRFVEDKTFITKQETKMTTKNTPHIHAEIIKAWADGVEIQNDESCGIWVDGIGTENWHPLIEYRVKPKLVYPKTTLTSIEINESYWKNGPEYESPNDGYKRICDEAIEHFIKSGAMNKYIKSCK